MKRTTSLLICFSFWFHACAPVPEIVDRYENSQKKTVQYVRKGTVLKRIDFYPDGRILSVTPLAQNRPHGNYVQYYRNGNEAVKGHFKRGRKNGCWTWLSPDGKPDSLRTYKNGILDGPWRDYSLGELVVEKTYHLGKLEGKYRVYSGPKQLKVRGSYLQDLPHGEWIWWGENGQKERLVTFDNGRKNGKVKVWSTTGKKVIEGQFAQDLKTGTWKWYREGHQLDSLVTYRAGIPDGPFKVWHQNGELAVKGFFQQGKEDGMWKWWAESGILDSLKTFSRGRLNGPRKVYFSNGQLALSQTFQDSTLQGEESTYFPSGALESRITFNNGEKSGDYEIYARPGLPEELGTYMEGKPHGKIQRWYSTGVPASTATYREGTLHGIMRIYSPSKVIVQESYYVEGEPHSRFDYFNNHRLKQVQIFRSGKPVYTRKWNELGVEIMDKAGLIGVHLKREYFSSGQLKYECTYKGDQKHGLEWWFQENGQLRKIQLYAEGELVLERVWKDDSRLSEDRVWDQGRMVVEIHTESAEK